MERRITRELLKDFEKNMFEDEKSNATIEKYLRDLHCFVNFANDRELDKTLAYSGFFCDGVYISVFEALGCKFRKGNRENFFPLFGRNIIKGRLMIYHIFAHFITSKNILLLFYHFIQKNAREKGGCKRKLLFLFGKKCVIL